MSNVEDWERRHDSPLGCSIFLTIMSFAAAGFFLGYPIYRWLFGNQQETPELTLLLVGGLSLFGGIAFLLRLIKGRPIPHVGGGGEAPPVTERYYFLPDHEDENHRDGPAK